jgi:signal transduction histidine kinase
VSRKRTPGPVSARPGGPEPVLSSGLVTVGDQSRRVAEAQAHAAQRLRRQRGTLRPLGWAATIVVVAGTFGAHPSPGVHGKALWVTVALAVFAAALAVSIRDGFIELAIPLQTAVISAMGAAGIALGGLQPRGATELAGGAAVWMAVARFPTARGVALGAVITIGLDVATALAGSSAAAVLATTLLCALLGLIAHFLRQARESQDRTELLLAQLRDAREEQTRAAAIAERGRIAGELHDVLAHSLSGAAIQLQGARLLAERERSSDQMRAAVDRASDLVKDGLADARQAVGALRGEDLPGVAQLPTLVEGFRRDMDLDVELRIDGSARTLPAEASLALYRGAQEALTNVARYAPGSSTVVVMSYEPGSATLSIEDRLLVPAAVASPGAGLTGVGGGRGLAGMRERMQRVGGTAEAGPTPEGWRVELRLPA